MNDELEYNYKILKIRDKNSFAIKLNSLVK